MGAIKDLFASERGFLALALIVCATVLTGLSHMTVDQWRDFSMTIFGIYVGGKTITGAVGLIKGPVLSEVAKPGLIDLPEHHVPVRLPVEPAAKPPAAEPAAGADK